MKYKLETEVSHWTCGDGCCEGSETKVIVNNIAIYWYSEMREIDIKEIEHMLSILSESKDKVILIYSAKIDNNGELSDTILLNGIEITEFWHPVYKDILDKLNFDYQYWEYEPDWDLWHNDNILELVLLEEE